MRRPSGDRTKDLLSGQICTPSSVSSSSIPDPPWTPGAAPDKEKALSVRRPGQIVKSADLRKQKPCIAAVGIHEIEIIQVPIDLDYLALCLCLVGQKDNRRCRRKRPSFHRRTAGFSHALELWKELHHVAVPVDVFSIDVIQLRRESIMRFWKRLDMSGANEKLPALNASVCLKCGLG